MYRYTVNGLWATLYIVQDQALHSLSKLWEGGLGLTCSHTNWNCESRRSRPKDLTENIPRAEVDPDGRCFLWWQAPQAAPCASHSQEWQGMKVQNNSLPRQKCLAAHERSEHRLERCWRRFFPAKTKAHHRQSRHDLWPSHRFRPILANCKNITCKQLWLPGACLAL